MTARDQMLEYLAPAPTVTRRCIRNNGRDFEEGFSCATDPSAAESAARAFARSCGFMASPSVHKLSACEWSVRWYSVD